MGVNPKVYLNQYLLLLNITNLLLIMAQALVNLSEGITSQPLSIP
ncbi:hypothetical protein SR1949_43610 [Sphaerospermopsis reniformis]|uniref:Uncharacterized protein n=1 Tax=Sphaerospermopsis reniformis TaxID=531300 RepID=A0A480A2Z6_9CYAN|nr:hypothetical protein SR1949_43610 [Sphaerospermopsis reniformis]